MMSLFSSFDLKFFYFQWFILLLVFSFIFSFYIKLSMSKLMLTLASSSLESFFNSMNSGSFNKFFCYISLSTMNLVFFFNFCGVWPYNFSFTSQMSIVCFLSLLFWLGLILYFFTKNLKGFLSHMVPEGTPIYLTWFLFLIEMVSNLIRPITLTVRLVANILAGHLLMILLFKLVYLKFFIFPFYILLNSVEIFVAFIQSYIFVTMVVLYFSELE